MVKEILQRVVEAYEMGERYDVNELIALSTTDDEEVLSKVQSVKEIGDNGEEKFTLYFAQGFEISYTV